MTTATDVLRKLLDECGIEWKDGDAAYEIEWSTPDGRHCSAMYWKPTFSVLISGCTPEQAIAATLWSETCEDVGRYCFTCSKCGWTANEPHHAFGGFWPKFCPNCGCKVVGE